MADNAAVPAANVRNLAKTKPGDVEFKELTTSGITVRGVADTMLFDSDKAEIKPTAAASLQ